MRDNKGEKVKLSLRETVVASKGMYPRLFSYVKPYKWRFVVGIIFGLLFGALNGVVAPVIAKVASVVFHGAIPNAKDIFKHTDMFSAGPTLGSLKSVIWACVLIPILMIIRSLLSFGNAYYMNWVSNRVVMDIRNELFGKLLNQSMDFYNKARTGFLMSRVANDTRSMQIALSTVSSDVFSKPVSIVAGIGGLLWLDWRFTIVTLILFPLCLIPIRLFGRRARRAVQDEQKGMVHMTVTMQETFSGIRVIKSFTREKYQEKSFVRSTRQQFSNAMRMVRASEAVGPMVETIASIGIGLALFYVYFARLPVGIFIGLMFGIFVLYDPFKTLSKLHIVIQRSVGATSKIFQLLDYEPTVQDRVDSLDLTSAKGGIEFDHVTFRYASGVANAVHNLDLKINPGKTYALVGASGAGKSTILSLLLRLYDPTSGVIRIDGQDLRGLTQRSLRQQMGLVTQETFLFHDTIYKNIQFGRLDATADEVYAAAQTAFAHDFIMHQPEGYETVVGDKGMMLSGGQQQRLAIARALLKNAPILLLDEATSALDSESEKQIQMALERLAQGRTVIAIAHRLSTILSADQIVVMDQGQVKEIGTHAELLAKSGHYRRLYDLQFNRINGDSSETTPRPDVLEEELV
jgi:subfamily B ATP-binding cassette protein MsbA